MNTIRKYNPGEGYPLPNVSALIIEGLGRANLTGLRPTRIAIPEKLMRAMVSDAIITKRNILLGSVFYSPLKMTNFHLSYLYSFYL